MCLYDVPQNWLVFHQNRQIVFYSGLFCRNFRFLTDNQQSKNPSIFLQHEYVPASCVLDHCINGSETFSRNLVSKQRCRPIREWHGQKIGRVHRGDFVTIGYCCEPGNIFNWLKVLHFVVYQVW